MQEYLPLGNDYTVLFLGKYSSYSKNNKPFCSIALSTSLCNEDDWDKETEEEEAKKREEEDRKKEEERKEKRLQMEKDRREREREKEENKEKNIKKNK